MLDSYTFKEMCYSLLSRHITPHNLNSVMQWLIHAALYNVLASVMSVVLTEYLFLQEISYESFPLLSGQIDQG